MIVAAMEVTRRKAATKKNVARLSVFLYFVLAYQHSLSVLVLLSLPWR